MNGIYATTKWCVPYSCKTVDLHAPHRCTHRTHEDEEKSSHPLYRSFGEAKHRFSLSPSFDLTPQRLIQNRVAIRDRGEIVFSVDNDKSTDAIRR